MKAILAIGGPVSTANTVKDNLRNRNYERVTNEHFLEAANKLKDLGLGHLVSCKNGSGRLVDVFIKKPPGEVMDIVQANSALCDPAVYISTFAGQTPVRLMRSSQLMENLIASGLVSQEHLKMHKSDPIESSGHGGPSSFDNYNMGQFDMQNASGSSFDASAQSSDDLFSLMDAHNIGPIDAQDLNQVNGQEMGQMNHQGTDGGQGMGQMNQQGTDNGQSGTIDGHSNGQLEGQNAGLTDEHHSSLSCTVGDGQTSSNNACDNVIPMENINIGNLQS